MSSTLNDTNMLKKHALFWSIAFGLLAGIIFTGATTQYVPVGISFSERLIFSGVISLYFIAASVILFWLSPLLLIYLNTKLGEIGMNLGRINSLALRTSLLSIVAGVFFALGLIFGAGEKGFIIKGLLVSLVFFVASAAAMCTIKFFYTNRENDE